MQKLINVLAVASFVVSAGVVASGTYVYLNRDALVDQVKEQVTEAAMGAMTSSLPSMLGGSSLPGASVPTGTSMFNPFN
jgi:hypothetical protein